MPRRRVLIADDDPLIRMDLAEMLAEEGFEVVGQVGDGQRAAALAKELRPDLVIMDVKMPGKDGIQAAAEIAAEQIAPVIILTAFAERDLIQRALDAGAMTYLAKPFSKATLLPTIELAAQPVHRRRRVASGNRRGDPTPSGPQGHRPGQGTADDPGRDDRTAGPSAG